MHPDTLKYINRVCAAKVNYGMPAWEIISTGLQRLDDATGGIARGHIVEIYGHEGSGKTALALHLAQQTGGPILYVDADGGLSPYILNGLNGLDLYLLRVETLENTLDACITAIAGGFQTVVIDTVAALPTNEDVGIDLAGEWTKCRSSQPKLMSKALPILSGLLDYAKCTLILVNQLREMPGVMCGRPDYVTGGRAIAYYASLRLKTHLTEKIRNREELIGQKIVVETAKCKYAPPGRRAELILTYGMGITEHG